MKKVLFVLSIFLMPLASTAQSGDCPVGEYCGNPYGYCPVGAYCGPGTGSPTASGSAVPETAPAAAASTKKVEILATCSYENGASLALVGSLPIGKGATLYQRTGEVSLVLTVTSPSAATFLIVSPKGVIQQELAVPAKPSVRTSRIDGWLDLFASRERLSCQIALLLK
jgi:hypothetical protein